MIPQKLTLSGFLSYQNPTEIDFSLLHVACITGQNGAGKSSMLDAITWALFGKARASEEAIINEAVSGQCAEVIFDFLFENDEYRIKRRKTRGKTGTVDFLIRAKDSDAWHTIGERTKSQTDKKICDVLRMDYDTFTNASFFLQGKADTFTALGPTNRKAILSSILNLEIWETYKKRAEEKRKKTELDLSVAQREIDEHQQELEQEEQRKAMLEKVTKELETASAVHKEAESTLEAAKQIHERYKSQKERVDELTLQERNAYKRFNTAQEQLKKHQAELDALQRKLMDAPQVEKDHAEFIELRKQQDDLNARKAAHQERLHRLQKFQNAIIAQRNLIEKDIQNLSSRERESRKRLSEIENARLRLADLNKQKTALDAQTQGSEALQARREECLLIIQTSQKENERLRKEGEELKTHISDLNAHHSGACPFCGKEMDEAHTLEYIRELEQKIEQARGEYAKNQDAGKAAQKELGMIDVRLREIQKAVTEYHKLEKMISSLSAQLDLKDSQQSEWERQGAPQLAALTASLEAEDFCIPERTELKAVEAEILQNPYDDAAHRACSARLQSLTGIEQRYNEISRDQARLEPLQNQIAEDTAQQTSCSVEWNESVEKVKAQKAVLDELSQTLPDLEAAKKAAETAQLNENKLRTEYGKAMQLVNALESVRKELESAKKKEAETRQLSAKYRTLEQCFGKKGIPALLIEQALPELEESANITLGRLTNDRMSLRFCTQKEYSDSSREDKNETLDILINDEYGTRSYELFSGGEAFRINFAIRLALSELLARRAGSRLQTLVIDEGFGSQDEEGRARLIEAISTIKDDFKKILVITHLSELKDAFPSRIEVQKTMEGSSVEVFA